MDNSTSYSPGKVQSMLSTISHSPKSSIGNTSSINQSMQECSPSIQLQKFYSSIDYNSFYKYLKITLNEVVASKIEEFTENSISKQVIQPVEEFAIDKGPQCRICKISKNFENNEIIESCNCETSYKYVHPKCLKEELEKRILDDMSRHLSFFDTENPILDRCMEMQCFKCKKCNHEYRLQLKIKHSFKQLFNHYSKENKLNLIRDFSLLFWLLFMVLANVAGICFSLLSEDFTIYACYLLVSLVLFVCGFTLVFMNFFEKMEESIWIFGKNIEEFIPLKDYLIFLEKKKNMNNPIA